MKNEKYHTVVTIPKYNIKIVERSKMDIISTLIHDYSPIPGLVQAYQ